MKDLTTQLSQYAAYHRDPRNIHTHFVGVPMIMFAVTILLSRPGFEVGGLPLSPAVLAALAASIFYFLLDLRYGIVMALVLALMLYGAHWCAGQGTVFWLGCGLGMFLAGWVIQFVGHYYEGRKPAFVDDIIGLLVGPLFVLAELGFVAGLRRDVQQAIERHAGPIRRRENAAMS